MPAGASAKSPADILKDYRKEKKYPKTMSAFLRLIFAIASDGRDPVKAMKGIEGIQKKFIDWNECRVSRWVEIARAMDPMPDSDKVAMRVKDMLNRLFDKKGTLSLDFCIDMKVTDARKALNELDLSLPKNQVNMILFSYHPTMTLPVSAEALEVAKKYKLIPKSGEKNHLQKSFAKLEHDESLELLHYLELEAVMGSHVEDSPVKKVAKKKTTKKRTTKS